MQSIRAAFFVLVLATISTSISSAQVVTNLNVQGQMNIFGAGHSDTSLVGGGMSPLEVSISPGTNRVLTFSNVTGTVLIAGAASPNGPDGGTTPPGFTNIDSTLGISGLIHTNRNMFLAGVFLSNAEPTDPAPIRLSFTSPEDFTNLVPLLHQTFFIGDGLTSSSNQVQTFVVPDSATRLFLGFIDGFSVTGPPGAYFDNSGTLNLDLQISAIPEPASLIYLSLAVLLAITVYWRYRQKVCIT